MTTATEALNAAPREVYVDHLDQDRLNNRRANLRAGTGRQNVLNSLKGRGSSNFLGVSWHKQKGKWAAQIKVDGRTRRLGLHLRDEDAARAYDAAALAEYGPSFKGLNFPTALEVDM